MPIGRSPRLSTRQALHCNLKRPGGWQGLQQCVVKLMPWRLRPVHLGPRQADAIVAHLEGGCHPQVPQLAALHHNDCRHLASQLLLLPHHHGPQLGQLVGDDAGFQEAALQLQQHGSTCLAQQVTPS